MSKEKSYPGTVTQVVHCTGLHMEDDPDYTVEILICVFIIIIFYLKWLL